MSVRIGDATTPVGIGELTRLLMRGAFASGWKAHGGTIDSDAYREARAQWWSSLNEPPEKS